MLLLLAVVHGSTEEVIHDLSLSIVSTTAESGLSIVTDAPVATAKPAVNATANATHAKNSTVTDAPVATAKPAVNVTQLKNSTNATVVVSANVTQLIDPPAEQKITDPETLRAAADLLAKRVRAVCDKAKAGPARVDVLRLDADRAFVTQQDSNVKAVAGRKGLSMDEWKDLKAKYVKDYAEVKSRFEASKKELVLLQTTCDSAKRRLATLIEAEDSARRTGITNVTKPMAAFNLTEVELASIPICDKVMNTKRFQKWLSWEYTEDRDMQKKEVACLASAVDHAKTHHKMLNQIASTVAKGQHLSRSAITCVVDPLAKTLFSSDKDRGQDLHPASALAVTNFLKAVESKIATPVPTADVLLETLLSEEPAVKLVAPVAANKLKKPPNKYTCLLETYKKAIGTYESEKQAIKDQTQKGLRDAQAKIPQRLGSSLTSTEGKCSDLLGTAFTKLNDEEQNRFTELESRAVNSTAALKVKFQAYMTQMQTYVSDHGKSQILKLKKAKRKAKRKIMKMTMKRKKAEDELLSLKDRFGTEKKLNDDQCVGNSCYMFTKIATPTMKSASAKQPADYKDMSWSCRRHSATAGHTRNLFTCYSEAAESKDMVVCNAKEVKIGEAFVPFLKQSVCPQGGEGKDASCKDVKQCSSSTLTMSSDNEQSLLRMNCASL